MASARRLRISKRNTVTIPVAMLREMGLKPGDLVVLRVEDGQIVIDNPLAQLERLAGSLAYPGMPVLTDEELEAAIHSARVEQVYGILRRPDAPILSDDELERAIKEATEEAATARYLRATSDG